MLTLLVVLNSVIQKENFYNIMNNEPTLIKNTTYNIKN